MVGGCEVLFYPTSDRFLNLDTIELGTQLDLNMQTL